MKWVTPVIRLWGGWIKRRRYSRRKIIVSTEVLEETLRLLRTYRGKKELHEGVVYWVGKLALEYVIICAAVAPDAETTPGSFDVGPIANAEVISETVQHDWQIIAQVHSHPGCSVDHSTGDSDTAFLPYPGYLSVVIPKYAQVDAASIAQWGVHLYTGSGFYRLGQNELQKQLIVVPSGPAAIIGVADGFKVATKQPDGSRVTRTFFSTFTWSLQDDATDNAPVISTGLPISPGKIIVVGAGAVGSNVLHFMRFLPVINSDVRVIDYDPIDYSNLNRCLAFGFYDVGHNKAEIAAGILNAIGTPATPFNGRFDQYMSQSGGIEADVLVPVANEYDVRWAIQNNVPPIMLHASTGRAWTVNVARHIPLKDFCLVCCFPEKSNASMLCGSGPISDNPKEPDAALPFVSPWGANLVVGEMVKLGIAGYPFTESRLSIESSGPMTNIAHHRGCKLSGCVCSELSEGLFSEVRGRTRFAQLSY